MRLREGMPSVYGPTARKWMMELGFELRQFGSRVFGGGDGQTEIKILALKKNDDFRLAYLFYSRGLEFDFH